MAPTMASKRLQSRLPDAPRTGVTNRRVFPLFFRLFLLRPMCLKHSKYCIELTFPSVATLPKNRPKKHQQMKPNTFSNRSKIGLRRLPNEASKNRRSQNPYFHRFCRFFVQCGAPLGGQGGEGKPRISVPRKLIEEPGSQNAPQMLPRPPQDGPKTPPRAILGALEKT